jgi:hypothetical protein
MLSPDDFFKAVFRAFESLLLRVFLIGAALTLALIGLGYWVSHC